MGECGMHKGVFFLNLYVQLTGMIRILFSGLSHHNFVLLSGRATRRLHKVRALELSFVTLGIGTKIL